MALAAAAVLTGVLAGCSPDEEAAQRRVVLEESVARTVDATLAFNLTVAADEETLAGFGDAAGPLEALLAGSSAAGVIEADRVAIGVAVAGADLAQVRVTGPGEQYVRFNLGALSQLATGSAVVETSRLESALADAGLDPAARDAVLAAAAGEWVRLETPREGRGAGEEVGGDQRSTATSVRDALAALLGAFDPVGHDGDLEQERFDGRLDVEVDVGAALAAAARALSGIAPGAVPTEVDRDQPLRGRVEVRDGVVRSVVLELGPLAGGEGSVELVLDLRELDVDEALVEAPEVVARVTREQLEAAAEALSALDGEAAP